MKIPYGKQFIDKNDVSNVVNALKKGFNNTRPINWKIWEKSL